MLVYNETFIIEDAIKDEWLQWINEVHIPAVKATGCFNDDHQMLTVLDSPNEGITYCIQYTTDAIERYSEFYYKHINQLHENHNKQFEGRFALFHTLMETV